MALHRICDTRNVFSPQAGDLPVGRFVDRGVQPPSQKYFCFRTPQITSRTFRIPSHTQGRFAIVTDVGHGRRWTQQRFAREIKCSRCLTPRDVDLAARPHVPTTFVHDLAGRLVCQKCKKAGKRPLATLLHLAPRQRHRSAEARDR
jgi:hypothetical protein